MNSPHSKDPWTRLVAAARQAGDTSEHRAPFGFATRVAALAEVAPRPVNSLFERFALRAVGLAALLALGSMAFTLSHSRAVGPNTDSPSEITGDDALTELVNV
jgi:hypothetical protein